MKSARPVDGSTPEFFSAMMPERIGAAAACARAFVPRFACFNRWRAYNRSVPRPSRPQIIVTASVHRFEESIGGRPYLIEVSAVSKDRWRAYIVRVPAMPTALMPFYGATPGEAARLLSDWLTRAHQRAASGPGSV
jgi:hypothetical protein